jgi:hypothetical protein
MTARKRAGWLDGMVDRGTASYQLPFHFWQEENTSCMQTRHQKQYRPPGLIIRDQGRSPARESLLDSCLVCAERGAVAMYWGSRGHGRPQNWKQEKEAQIVGV